jgi:predicted TIM-barrel fold metal-dependent hydrolase
MSHRHHMTDAQLEAELERIEKAMLEADNQFDWHDLRDELKLVREEIAWLRWLSGTSSIRKARP